MPCQLGYFEFVVSGGVVNWTRWYIPELYTWSVYLEFLKRRSFKLQEKSDHIKIPYSASGFAVLIAILGYLCYFNDIFKV